jgi:signal recognition particle receptor subunit beta
MRRLPWVFQYNKRDLPVAVPLGRLRAALNPAGSPEFEAVASEGRGVTETLRAICKAVLARLASETPAASATPPAAPAPTTSQVAAARTTAPA